MTNVNTMEDRNVFSALRGYLVSKGLFPQSDILADWSAGLL